MTKATAAKISAEVLAVIARGYSVIEALRFVLGAELVDRMIDELYCELRDQSDANLAAHIIKSDSFVL
jgi:hypothetical protein